jgi:outer membrane immunogenic protein
MMRNSSIALFALTAAIAAPAAATDFAGARAELRGGWDRTTIGVSYNDASDSISGSDHKDGFNLGAEIGYDFQAGQSLVAGAYAGIEGATTKVCSELVGNDRACLKLGRNFTVGARLGAKVSPLVMVYAKGGYSNGQLRTTYDNADDPTLDVRDHVNRGGFHIGVGGEVAVGRQGYVRAEYVRTNYNDYDYADPDVHVNVDGHRDQGLVGFGIRF